MQTQAAGQFGTEKPDNLVSLGGFNAWPCGHERTAENAAKCGKGRTRCRTCSLVKGRAYHHVRRAPKPYDSLVYRQKYLPQQIEATERKLQMLRREAVRIGLGHLVGGQV